jgi:hypothetical protein
MHRERVAWLENPIAWMSYAGARRLAPARGEGVS